MTARNFYPNRVFWITGASSGIGRALAEGALSGGASVVLTARRSEPLAEVTAAAPERSVALPADLEDLGGIDELVKAATNAFGRLDGLFYAAGTSQRAEALDTNSDVEERLFAVNYWAAVRIIKALAPKLAPPARIVMISSLAAYVATPLRSSYSAAKSALASYTESASVELLARDIRVVHAVPGFVRTEISRAALRGDGALYGKMDANQARGMSPEECAKRILTATAKGRPRIFVALGVKGRLALFLSRVFPGLLQHLLRQRD